MVSADVISVADEDVLRTDFVRLSFGRDVVGEGVRLLFWLRR